MTHKTAVPGIEIIQAHKVRIRLDELVPHEKTSDDKRGPLRGMKKHGVQKRPIVVHQLGKHKYFIVDGHHRVEALEELGCKFVIANVVDYFHPCLSVKSWESDEEWDKEKLIAKALRGLLRRPKSTKHVLVVNGEEMSLHKHDVLEPVINYPLDKLR